MPFDSDQTDVKLPKVAVAAVVFAFLWTALILLSALHVVFISFYAVVPAAAGICILRRVVWGAYGFACFLIAQAAITPLLLVRSPAIHAGQALSIVILDLPLAVLFFFAGRSLARSGATKGLVFPWIAVSGLSTLPFLFFQAFVIPTSSMENSLLLGDRIVVRTFPKGIPAPGDMIVFRNPFNRSVTYVKRVIGLPGDRLRIAAGVVYKNGTALSEPYVIHRFTSSTEYRNDFPGALANFTYRPRNPGGIIAAEDMLKNHVFHGEVVVPLGKYFVLGDNRDNSLDSRYLGFSDVSDIIGKPSFIIDSEVPQDDQGRRKISLGRKRWNRIFKVL